MMSEDGGGGHENTASSGGLPSHKDGRGGGGKGCQTGGLTTLIFSVQVVS